MPVVGERCSTSTNMMIAFYFRIYAIEPILNEDFIMIGDASGKEGQFSDSDLRTAENFGIDYMDVNDFVSET